MKAGLTRELLAEFVGTAALLAVIVGSGHMGEVLANGNAAIALLANSTATGLMLYVLIVLFAPISGAHFNPIVSLAFAWRSAIGWRKALLYIPVQVIGALAGVILAHAMFGLPLFELGTKARIGWPQYLSEGVATAGLLATIFLGHRARPNALPALVGAYIAAAYWFTASTAFANPAVTIARAFTDTFAGIRPVDAPAFLIAQIAGAALGLVLVAALTEHSPIAHGIHSARRRKRKAVET
ncbi:MIP/aquaporin family protein [Novosphingobium sp.]|uniref:MIP/aquaporin family protein n=1 Tax=Novosphingobium sp. TaxID=1874826 RepID=UPI002FD9A023